ncbi:uncharacterized protein LOC131655301 [Vicia villosa]|uniref:uncharacterized protein LOC131655301 n=1 Tax=Vicia villosa TaxID=3911 RepID=UPI00273C7EC2|nr:uncharacterized protein LOC131655301 [Vicia villosa]
MYAAFSFHFLLFLVCLIRNYMRKCHLKLLSYFPCDVVSRAILIARNPSSGDDTMDPLVKVVGESKSVAASNSSADVTERASPNETISPSNMQCPSTVLPSIITSDSLSRLLLHDDDLISLSLFVVEKVFHSL